MEWILLRLITIYDCKIELKWTGKASDGTEVDGTLSIPEVSHEITLDGLSEYSVNNLFVVADSLLNLFSMFGE